MSDETCLVDGQPVLVMSRKGTGYCSIRCEKTAGVAHASERPAPHGSADLANATEDVRNEPECAT